jgi:hypothetical protein
MPLVKTFQTMTSANDPPRKIANMDLWLANYAQETGRSLEQVRAALRKIHEEHDRNRHDVAKGPGNNGHLPAQSSTSRRSEEPNLEAKRELILRKICG